LQPGGEIFLREIRIGRKAVEIHRSGFALQFFDVQSAQSAFQRAHEQALFDARARRVGNLGGNRAACQKENADT
jgi:hypothetical protein